MSSKTTLKFTPAVLLFPLLFVFTMWLVYWIEIKFVLHFNTWGVYPRTLKGLRGVLFSPFIHSDLKHLFNNTVPMFVLTMALVYFYHNVKWRVFFLGFVITGVFTWILGRPANHIGASGLIYMLTAFLFFKGVFSKQYQLTALAFVVVFLYGSLVWYAFPGMDPKISWEGHLSGFIAGFLLSLVFKENPIENKKYAWEQEDFNPDDDPFIRQFDENGNFIEPVKENGEDAFLEENQNEKFHPPIVTYHYSEPPKKESTNNTIENKPNN